MRAGVLLLGLAVVFALGCGGSKPFAPVSGKVMMDGKPLANATVTFAPVREAGSVEAGVPSAGKTDEKGEFSLQGTNGKARAQVGMHVVTISVITEQAGDTGDERPANPVRGGPPLSNKVPPKYNEKSELKFEVKPGNNEANFLDLQGR
jgi:hypothetical protein